MTKRKIATDKMKNIQVIDRSMSSDYAIYAVTEEEFGKIFPGERQNVEFIEDLIDRLGRQEAAKLLGNVWERRVTKREVSGIHGTLFYELLWKKEYYPAKNDTEMVVPPERTPVEYVGRVARLDVSMYVYGDDLDPDAVTDILGLVPRFACRKGHAHTTSTGKTVTRKTGVWSYELQTESTDVEKAILQLVDQLIAQLGQREKLLESLPGAETGFIELLFFMTTDKGDLRCFLELTPAQVSALCSYGLPLRLSMYGSPPD
jgi:hypothetical protein